MDTKSLAARVAALLEGPDGRGVVAVYLYGSHAAGRAHHQSDVDVGVVLRHAAYPTARDRFEARLRLQALLQPAAPGAELDLVILNDAPAGLAAAVANAGQLLLCQDAEEEHAFRRDSQLRRADLRPFLERAAALKREAIGP